MVVNFGHEVRLVSIDEAFLEDLGGFDKVVVGASIRYGKHNKKVFEFVAKNEKYLEEKSSAFFSVNVVARKPDKKSFFVRFRGGLMRWRYLLEKLTTKNIVS